MITVIINYNDDCVTIENEANRNVITVPIKNSLQEIKELLVAIFDTHDEDMEDRVSKGIVENLGVQLREINEDTDKFLHEW